MNSAIMIARRICLVAVQLGRQCFIVLIKDTEQCFPYQTSNLEHQHQHYLRLFQICPEYISIRAYTHPLWLLSLGQVDVASIGTFKSSELFTICLDRCRCFQMMSPDIAAETLVASAPPLIPSPSRQSSWSSNVA